MWVIFALILSLVAAALAEANRHFKMDGFRLNFWRTVIMSFTLLPVGLIVEWPGPSMYYVAAVFSGVVSAVSPAIRMSLSAQKMGRVTTLFMPIEAAFGFALWLMLDDILRETLFGQPIRLAFVGVSFLVITAAMATMRKNDASWKAFLIVAPLGVMHALSGVLAKYGMADVNAMMEQVILFMLLTNIFGLTFSACFLSFQKDLQSNLCPPGMMRAAAFYGGISLVGQFSFFYAINHAPSPGYVVAIAMIAPVWIMAYRHFRKLPDDANPQAGLVMVGAAIMLVILAAL